MAVIPGTIGGYPTVQSGTVPFAGGKAAVLLGFVSALAALACTVSGVGGLTLPVGATAAMLSPVAALAAVSLAPDAQAQLDEDVSATIRLNAREVREV